MTVRASLSLGLSFVLAGLGTVLAGCGADDGGSTPVDTGGASGSGGAAGPSGGSGATPSSGGIGTTGGATNVSGATSSGGMTTNSGGSAGTPGSGGAPGGGAGTSGGASFGGSGAGGASGGTAQSGGSGGAAAGSGGFSAKGGTTGSGGSSTGGASGGAGAGGKSGATGGSGQGGSAGAAGATSTGGTGGACTLTWEPPATLAAGSKTIPLQSALDAVWDYSTKNDNVTKNTNWIFDQIIANKGSLNYCVRVDLKTNSGGSSTTISAEQRTQYKTLLETWLNNWVETWLKGWGCWPYGHVPVNITGWAVPSASTLTGTVDPSQAVYVNQNDADGIPRCPDACFHGLHKDGNFSGCTGGAAMHWDLSLWLTYGMGLAGYGYDWGQQLDLNVTQYQHILGHEMGHGFGLPDFYSGGSRDFYTLETSADAQALKGAGFIMQAGSAAQVSTFDGWMLRQQWYKFERARHGF